MASLDFILGALGLGGKAVGALGQKKAAQFCYKVYRRAQQSHPDVSTVEWEDLTQRQQELWMAAVWDEADIDSKLIPKE